MKSFFRLPSIILAIVISFVIFISKSSLLFLPVGWIVLSEKVYEEVNYLTCAQAVVGFTSGLPVAFFSYGGPNSCSARLMINPLGFIINFLIYITIIYLIFRFIPVFNKKK